MKVSVFIAASLDGFIARENGELDWLEDNPTIDGEDYGYEEFFSAVDALVMGRGTFEKVQTFGKWPYGSKKVYVLTHHPEEVTKSDNYETLDLSPLKFIEYLKSKGIERIYLDGGKTIQEFLRHDLVDEMTITIIPKIIGSGIPLFGNLEKEVQLDHISTSSFANGFVQSTYKIRN